MSVFKAYDVRGLYPQELNEEMAYNIGRALVVFTKARSVLVGIDARSSSPSLRDAFAAGCTEQGADVTQVQYMTSSQLLALRAWTHHDAAAIVTASHMAKEYNGLKMGAPGGMFISQNYGLPEIEAIVQSRAFPESERKGTIRHEDYTAFYAERIQSLCTPTGRVKFVIDCSNGSVGPEISCHVKDLNLDATIINAEPDGNFPNHSPNPLSPGALDQAREKVLECGADGGVVFDADADRVYFLDEHGDPVHTNYTACLIIERLLRANKGEAVVYDLISSRVIPELIQALGGKPMRSKVGHANVKDMMLPCHAIFGAETSGHVFFKDTEYGEATTLVLLHVLDALGSSEKPFSSLVRPYAKYALLPETNYTVNDADATIKRLEAAFPEASKDYLDGVYLSLSYGWISLRKSNTEPLLRLRAEADTKAQLQEMFRRVETVVLAAGGVLNKH